jgi:hypothetical protein
LCSEFAAVVVSLFAYFLYIVTAFAAIMGLLVVAFNGATLDRTLHYPRPIMDHSVAAAHSQGPLFMMATNDGTPAKNTPAAEPKAPDAVAAANTGTEKTKRERPAHPHKVVVRRENSPGRDYTIAQSYSGGGFGYRPGLDAQR